MMQWILSFNSWTVAACAHSALFNFSSVAAISMFSCLLASSCCWLASIKMLFDALNRLFSSTLRANSSSLIRRTLVKDFKLSLSSSVVAVASSVLRLISLSNLQTVRSSFCLIDFRFSMSAAVLLFEQLRAELSSWRRCTVVLSSLILR